MFAPGPSKLKLAKKTEHEPADFAICKDDVLGSDAERLWLWGRNEHGELNRGHKHSLNRPCLIALPHTLAQLAFGHEHMVALMTSHELYSAGSWVAGKQGDPEITSCVLASIVA